MEWTNDMMKEAPTGSTRLVNAAISGIAVMLLAVTLLLGYEIYTGKKDKERYEQRISALSKSIESEHISREGFEKRILDERYKFNASIEDQKETIKELRRELRQKEAELRSGLSESREKDLKEVKALRHELGAIQTEKSWAQNTINKYGGAVCFLYGSYGFVEKSSGKFLRYRGKDAQGEPLKDKEGHIMTTVEGDGETIVINYTGTGFLASTQGFVLTNRHVVEHWFKNELAQRLMKMGYVPKFRFLHGYFPKIKTPFDLTVVKLSEKADVALLKTNLNGAKLPVVKLDRSGPGAAVGQPVVLLGYPAGFHALLARIDEKTSESIVKTTGAESDKLAQELANRGLIRPLTTQGHLSDILTNQIIYDAQTTFGGSGGPLFNSQREVIGISSSILKEFSGSNFGVPIKYGIELLKQPQQASTSIRGNKQG